MQSLLVLFPRERQVTRGRDQYIRILHVETNELSDRGARQGTARDIDGERP